MMKKCLRYQWLVSACAMFSAGQAFAADIPSTPVCSYRILHTYLHDAHAFTQGLFFSDGVLYESTGQKGASRLFTRTLESTTPITEGKVDPTFFGEGSAPWGDQIISLTWRDGYAVRWDRKTLKPIALIPTYGEGWGLTIHDGTLYESDGSSILTLRDPATFASRGTINVTDQGRPVRMLNELEWINGEIWANVWMSERIARIDPATGHVTAWIDFSGLGAKSGGNDRDSVLNGIAWDKATNRIFITGKYWDKLYQIEPVCS